MLKQHPQDQFSIAKLINKHQQKFSGEARGREGAGREGAGGEGAGREGAGGVGGRADHSLPPVLPHSYRNTSQVNDLLHPTFNSSRIPDYHLTQTQNPITQQTISRLIPINTQTQTYAKNKLNTISHQHQNWLTSNRQFTKPYSDCTKYIDSLSQNKALIRRGPFNIPLGKQRLIDRNSTTEDVTYSRQSTDKVTNKYSISNNLSRLKSASCSVNQISQIQYKSMFRTKKDMIVKSLNNLKEDLTTIQSRQSRQRISKSINSFDRSLKNTVNNYEILMKKERKGKLQQIVLKNSSNKLLAIDLIRQKMEQNNGNSKNNLKKIQQKFKKRHEFKIKVDN